MLKLAMGGAKGEPGKIPRAAFEGARTVNKATRTLWLIALRITTAMPSQQFSKTPAKTHRFYIHIPKVCTVEDTRRLRPSTPWHWLGPRSLIRFARQCPSVPSIDRAWRRRPRQCPRYRGAPTRDHLQTLLETRQP